VPSERSGEEKTGVSPFSLAHVCKEIRAEFRPLFIARTTFVIRGGAINAFIDSIILLKDTDISTLVARIRVEPGPLGAFDFKLDLKPLLQLSQVAEEVSLVFKQTAYYTEIDLAENDEVQDRTLQELLEEMLGIHDFAMFIAFAERAIPQIKLYADTSYARIRGDPVVEVNTNALWLEVSISAHYWSPLLALASDEYGWDQRAESKTLLRKIEKVFGDGGMGVFPRLDGQWYRTSFIKSDGASTTGTSEDLERWQWQERMEGLTWSGDMKGGKTPGKVMRYYD
jgi:hypothetical protein